MLNIKRIVGACLVCISALGAHAQNVPDTLNANQRRMFEALDSATNSSELSENEDVTVYRHLPKSYRYRVQLADKKQNRFSVKHPEAFLSAKALARRSRYGLKIDAYDLPVSDAYVNGLRNLGLRIHNMSKWNNTVVVETADTTLMQRVRQLAYVKGVRCVWESPDSLPVAKVVARESEVTNKRDTTLADYYGYAAAQVKMLGVDQMHQQGYNGNGVTIGVIDGGFHNADLMAGIDQTHILGTRNFVQPAKSVYEEQSHGMMVLSCIGANEPHYLVGTAPCATFYLLQSEDEATEQLVEEDNWCAALEYADSLGCDMVSSSLGYYQFDHKYMNHHYYELDGQTAVNSRSASLAASRGILLVNSAGNSGSGVWKKIGFPADACHIITAGAVNTDSINTPFSSIGNTADGRVKPDLMAVGLNSMVYDIDGTVVGVNGTSFSCPTLCGAAACLVQAFPNVRPATIIKALQQSADNAAHPDNINGYGIPNVVKAAEWLRNAGVK